jgi:hypothetical protein
MKQAATQAFMSNDKGLEYNAIKLNAENLIKKIKLTGIDVSKEENILNSIDQKLKEEIAEHERQGYNHIELGHFAFATNETIYLNAINDLNKLIDTLNEYYATYIKINNNCEIIKAEIDANEVNSDNINGIVKLMISTLDYVKKSSTIYYSKEEDLVDLVYKLAYSLIKMELILNGSSNILNYVNSSSIDVSFINKEIGKDVETIDLKNPSNLELKKLVISSDDSLVNEEVIAKIIIAKHELDTSEIYYSLEKILRTIETNQHNMLYELESRDIEMTYCHYKKDDVKKISKKEINKTIAALLVTASLFTGSIFLGNKLLDKLFTKTKYNTKEEVYSTIDDTTKTTNSYEEQAKNGIVEVKVYGKWHKFFDSFHRVIKVYTISKIDYEVLKNYLNLDFKALGINYHSIGEDKNELTPEDQYNEPYKEVISYDSQDTSDSKEINDLDISGKLLILTAYFFSLSFLDLSIAYESDYKSRYGMFWFNLYYLLDQIKTKKNYDKDDTLYRAKIDEINTQIRQILDENIELKERFINYYKLYGKNLDINGHGIPVDGLLQELEKMKVDEQLSNFNQNEGNYYKK